MDFVDFSYSFPADVSLYGTSYREGETAGLGVLVPSRATAAGGLLGSWPSGRGAVTVTPNPR